MRKPVFLQKQAPRLNSVEGIYLRGKKAIGNGEGYFIQPAASGDHWSPISLETLLETVKKQIRIISSNRLKSWGFHTPILMVPSECVGEMLNL